MPLAGPFNRASAQLLASVDNQQGTLTALELTNWSDEYGFRVLLDMASYIAVFDSLRELRLEGFTLEDAAALKVTRPRYKLTRLSREYADLYIHAADEVPAPARLEWILGNSHSSLHTIELRVDTFDTLSWLTGQEFPSLQSAFIVLCAGLLVAYEDALFRLAKHTPGCVEVEVHLGGGPQHELRLFDEHIDSYNKRMGRRAVGLIAYAW